MAKITLLLLPFPPKCPHSQKWFQPQFVLRANLVLQTDSFSFDDITIKIILRMLDRIGQIWNCPEEYYYPNWKMRENGWKQNKIFSMATSTAYVLTHWPISLENPQVGDD